MDKNTIIGFLLIGIVLIVFTWLNQPTPEQIEAQRRMQDSIARIEYAKQLEQQKELNREAKADDELAGRFCTACPFTEHVWRFRQCNGWRGGFHCFGKRAD